MKKRWIPFIVMCLIICFLLGLQHGSGAEVDRMRTRQEIQIFTQTAIAVVNSDEGVVIDDSKLNYSEAIINTLGKGFFLVSNAAAVKGFENGTYGAVITFPSDVSKKIVSINSSKPEKVQLEYIINNNLSEKDYLETYMTIMQLQLSINSTLASTYVSSIYLQFQQAQDQVDGIFKNDESDLEALNVVTLNDFSSFLDTEELPEIELEPEPADTESYFASVEGFAGDVAGIYLGSWAAASRDYLSMREVFFALRANLLTQEDKWLGEMSDWSMISVDYGELLEIFAADVQVHEDALVEWYNEIAVWYTDIDSYKDDVVKWHETLTLWYGNAEDIKEVYQGYLNDAVLHMVDVSDEYRDILAGDTLQAIGDLQVWQENLDKYVEKIAEERDELATWRTTLQNQWSTYKTTIDELPAIPELSDPAYSGDTDLYAAALAEWIVKAQAVAGDFPDLPTPPPTTTIDNTQPPEYNGAEIPELDEELLQPKTEMPEVQEWELPPEYDGEDAPETVKEANPMNVEQPDSPLVDPPPRPDDFWASLEDMYEHLSEFEVDSYLTDDLKQNVAVLLDSYANYLGVVRADISTQFEMNVLKLFDAQIAYEAYLSGLKSDTIQAETDARNDLQSVLREYAGIKTSNSTDTQERLGRFAKMMPESRSPAGLNRNLVGFTVEPFEFISPAIRAEEDPVPFVQTSVPFTEMYNEYLRIAIWAAGAVLMLTLVSYGVSYYRVSKR